MPRHRRDDVTPFDPVSWLWWHPNVRSFNDEEKAWLNIDTSRAPRETFIEVYRRAYRVRSVDEMAEHVRTKCLGDPSLICTMLISANPTNTSSSSATLFSTWL
ncbi:uncharacterized protein N7515_010261 [Penicillium bovifimosum]|uniref:Uncharacterized protein n=1 Tax=Penicillium bovifimosum TaxID=126998 RepID=A0A9W9GI16_9EURO|nr:uncharacterized protein N7515_010261 [Penicillium bovifimosum]KAJ5120873.1 hypothetical protein N7515_010261 [Penicillium bovifimosum]